MNILSYSVGLGIARQACWDRAVQGLVRSRPMWPPVAR